MGRGPGPGSGQADQAEQPDDAGGGDGGDRPPGGGGTTGVVEDQVVKAEPVGPPRHVVVKGETLTSIAKHYNIPLAELHKANKDVNERKLQIGQTISIPLAPAPKPAEPAPEKTP